MLYEVITFSVFFMIGSVTFGGGLAMLPILERELVTKRGWMTGTQMVDWFAIGQCTPGIIAVNVSTFIGYSRRGIVGAVVATLGIITVITSYSIHYTKLYELWWTGFPFA